METKSAKSNIVIIVAAVVVIFLLLLVIAGNFFGEKVDSQLSNTNTNVVSSTSTPFKSSEETVTQSLNDLIMQLIFAVSIISAIILGYFYFFKNKVEDSNENLLAHIRNYAFNHCDKLILNDDIHNMRVEDLGNVALFYFVDINITFRVDKESKFISHNKIILAHAVDQINKSTLLQNIISGSSGRDVLINRLKEKGYEKSDIEKKIQEIENQIVTS